MSETHDDRPACFVIMPFQVKTEPATGRSIDFDVVYRDAIRPGVERAGMNPMRGGEQLPIGIIHDQFLQQIVMSPFAVADLTTANANVFYEFGVRHAVKPRTTVGITGNDKAIPFDVSYLQAVAYPLDAMGNLVRGEPLEAFIEALATALKQRAHLGDSRFDPEPWRETDSPLFRLMQGYNVKIPELPHLRSDAFIAMANSQSAVEREMDAIRERFIAGQLSKDDAVEQLDALADRLLASQWPNLVNLSQLFITYRAVSAWPQMLALHERMPEVLRAQRVTREQHAFALNRQGETTKDAALVAEALKVLEDVKERFGADAETCGLIGRIHKRRWEAARKSGDITEPAHLEEAIAAYRQGFELDPRDYYPGVNLCTLLAATGEDGKAELDATVPVVRYAATRHIGTSADYWGHATLLELAVLARDAKAAQRQHIKAVPLIKEDFQPGTTANNLTIILDNAPDPDALAFAVPIRDDLVARARSA
ncbi:TRAFs-binding domain-containing protein [Acuticoccus sp. I52.16.1]|uniref:TRAFs-binding domain-containing protein n=1 Tax=Acuticoccus sp. I52.16.1 TaxID=2928472 RepID=UPI001FD23EB2|nr:TRAFs-binding domain-containing protein [Acuticoccus sp. I52.16.1]UOM36737.1 DUF4071 domain-containing protein [Acuticoccus sp. I52.16.1]